MNIIIENNGETSPLNSLNQSIESKPTTTINDLRRSFTAKRSPSFIDAKILSKSKEKALKKTWTSVSFK
jgi:hypothetical protein